MTVIRKTKTVDLLLNTFKGMCSVSTLKLVEKFKSEMNKTTVYRILDRLEKSNIPHSFIDNEGQKRYAKNITKESKVFNPHPHFLCEDCGISSCVAIDMKVPRLPDYNIRNSEHLLIGQCKKCLS